MKDNNYGGGGKVKLQKTEGTVGMLLLQPVKR